jgi:hypothetical protein
VEPALSSFTEEACTLDVSDATVGVVDLTLDDLDVTPLASTKSLAPTVQSRLQ